MSDLEPLADGYQMPRHFRGVPDAYIRQTGALGAIKLLLVLATNPGQSQSTGRPANLVGHLGNLSLENVS
jgi:hypothetical protein